MSDAENPGLRQGYRALDTRIKKRRILFEGGEFLVAIGKAVSLVAVILSLIPLSLSLFLGYSFNMVLTPSMTPTLPVGSVAVTAPYLGQELPVGTIFGYEATGGERILHRVDSYQRSGDALQYIAKGDSNNTVDLVPVESSQIWGVGVNVLEGPLAFFVGSFSWDGNWAAQTWQAASAGDWGAFFALLPGISWGALFLIGFVVLFWWLLPSLLVSLGNRLVRSDEAERKRLDTEFSLRGYGDQNTAEEPEATI